MQSFTLVLEHVQTFTLDLFFVFFFNSDGCDYNRSEPSGCVQTEASLKKRQVKAPKEGVRCEEDTRKHPVATHPGGGTLLGGCTLLTGPGTPAKVGGQLIQSTQDQAGPKVRLSW